MTTIDRSRTAVLVMDCQTSLLGRLGEAAASLTERVATVVGAARGAGLPVMYVVVGFRAGYPEISPRNKAFAAVSQTGMFAGVPHGEDIHPTVKPLVNEAVVVKHRVGAFAGTDLDMLLRARSVETVVLLGIATGGVVLSTVRAAADADYGIVVVSDGCADADPEVHRVLMDKVFPRQASVMTCAEVIAALA